MRLSDAKLLAETLMAEHLVNFPGWIFSFDNARRRAGLCSYSRKTISLSIEHIMLNAEAEVRDTILHEIAHVLAGESCGHNRTWKLLAVSVGARPERCSNAVISRGRYVGTCEDCGAELSVSKLCKLVKHGGKHTTCKHKPKGGSICRWRDTKTNTVIISMSEGLAYFEERKLEDKMRREKHPDLIVSASGDWKGCVEVTTADGKRYNVLESEYNHRSDINLLSNYLSAKEVQS